MKHGLFFSFQVPHGSDTGFERPYREMLDCLPLAEELGYSTALFASHHVQAEPWCPSPLVALGGAAGVTSRMRIGTGVLLVPLYAPLKLAEDVAVLDNLSAGRFVFGVAPGYVSEEFAAHGVPRDERVPRLEEALDLMVAAWTQERASYEGRFYRLPESPVTPKPVQKPYPPIWYGVSGAKSLRLAARRKAVLVASPRHGLAELREHFAIYDEEAAAVGHAPAERPVIRGLFVAETTREAEEIAGPAVTSLFRELYGAKSAAGERVLRTDEGEVVTDTAAVDFEHFKRRYIIGDPELARREVERYRAELGATEILAWMHLPGIPAEHTNRSVELFAREVMPAFADADVNALT
jgi:alkanesulfonate monooxygenase SsuD/methylene tetrahydromethanopterin reductase-like flavin-dependent oxidoreductase (luciferase family)